ncbi:MFS transporter [Plantibacter sp. YIM 135249]|uniref:MFS transporter n=1 Tax=Plantibacter sp. YIM 135249 TaxID=3423918 RepID=UPI003D344327
MTSSVTSPSGATTTPPPFPWTGLLALSAATFLSVTGEMIPTGLLPEMSSALGVSESQIGLLVSVFAFTVVLTSTPIIHFTAKVSRHTLLVTVIAILGVSTALGAIAPSYELLLATRVMGGLAHGVFWALVGAYAAHLVPKEQIARAVAVTVAGGTLAFVLGVPLGTALGHALGWRLAFGVLAGLMILGAALVWWKLPTVDREESTAAKGAVSTGRDPSIKPVAIVCIAVAIIMIGHYSFYTYIAPYLIDQVGIDPGQLSILLLVYGVAGAIGLLLTGTVFAKHATAGLFSALIVSALSVTALALLSGWMPGAIIAFFIWGAAFGMLPPLMQTRLLHAASPRIRDAANAFYTTAFNTGIGGGSAVGALLLDKVGLHVLPWVYVGLFIVAGLLLGTSSLVTRRRAL